KGFIRRQLGSVLRTKSIPDLRFHYDDAAESADRMEDLIEQARDKDRELRGEPESPGSEPPTSEPPGA
ncbi:MAG: ribosome-binding factor A, partial [Planctomycetota bacterium]